MNITELARKLKVPTRELREKLPRLGFDIGPRAIKIPDAQARKVIQMWHEFIEAEKEVRRREEEVKEEVPAEEVMKEIVLPSSLTVRELAELLGISPVKVIQELMKNGVVATINKQIDFDTAAIVAEELGYRVKEEPEEKKEEKRAEVAKVVLEKLLEEADKAKLRPKPPVVVVMGHIDHGKTSLLDAIRKTHVVAEEAGAITQRIGAYQVEKNNELITFIDTPGHEAFRSMRARGGQVADMAILVIAADDKIQPQTMEAIKIIQQEKLPFVVAINKIDLPTSDVERIKKGLAEIKLLPEDWGGDVICLPISAKTGQGIDELIDSLLLVAEMEKERLVANPERAAVGTIIETRLDPGEGPVGTVIIQTGTLKIGDWISVGQVYGKIRALKDFQGRSIKEAKPGMPVRIMGLKGAPQVGDILKVVKDRKALKEIIKKADLRYQRKAFADRLRPRVAHKEEAKDLNIILRADVLGSLEAISESLGALEHPEINLNVIKKGLGNIIESDILLAEATSALVIGFNASPTPHAVELAKDKGVEVKTYDIIYRLLDEIREKMTGLLKKELVRTDLGKLEVLALFRKEPKSMIIGGKVTKGKMVKGAKIDVKRKGELVAQGLLSELQISKRDVPEAPEGSECGIKFVGKPVIEVGDILEVYKEEEKERKLEM